MGGWGLRRGRETLKRLGGGGGPRRNRASGHFDLPTRGRRMEASSQTCRPDTGHPFDARATRSFQIAERATAVAKLRAGGGPGFPQPTDPVRRADPLLRRRHILSHRCYACPMAKVITQRTLRNESGEIMRGLDRWVMTYAIGQA